jgi:biotin synthase
MSKKNTTLSRYTLSIDIVKIIIEHFRESGIRQLHLVAGEDENVKMDEICSIIEFASSHEINTTVVLGKKTVEEYQSFFQAGARRYIMKFETSNDELFKKLKKRSLADRIQQLSILRDIGFKIGTGIIVDLPGSNIDDLINDLVLIESLSPDMASASAFSSNMESELRNCKEGNIENTILFIALMRIVIKKAQMISCSSSLGNDGQIRALMAGANVISYHATPENYIDNFSSYKSNKRIKTKMENIQNIADQCGMEIKDYE